MSSDDGETKYTILLIFCIILKMRLNTVYCLIAASILAVLHFISLEFYLYWRYLWIDIPIHALGGAVIALLAFVPYDLNLKLPKRWLQIWPVMALVLIAALVWEVYELAIGLPIDIEYPLDTVTDLIAGVVGGYLGFVVGQRLYKLKNFEQA